MGSGTAPSTCSGYSSGFAQDYLFLIEYSRLLALAVARAPDLDTMGRFADLLHERLRVEMDLHRSYSADIGIPATDLEREVMAPTTRGHTDFLVRTATVGDFAELVAALLPCMWGFHEIGCRLAEHGPPHVERYARWVEMYPCAGGALAIAVQRRTRAHRRRRGA